MGFLSKLLGGGLGWAFGGPIGAIIGLALATLFDMDSSKVKEQLNRERSANYQNVSVSENDFRMALLVLMAAVMKADGTVKKSELDVVKKYLLQTYGENAALESLQILKQLLKQNYNVNEVAIQVGQHLNYSSKTQLVHMLFAIAVADGQVLDAELRVIRNISMDMNVSQADFQSIYSMYNKKNNNDWAYEVLQISKDASDEDVKKAYRRMAMKFHPDKVNNLGEDVKKNATEKFRKINEAYNFIKKQRGLN